MVKTYHKRVFGGKDADWRGIDQSKCAFYTGALEMSLNAVYDDFVFKPRVGQVKVTQYSSGAVLSGKKTLSQVIVNAGTDLYSEEL